MTLSIPAQTQIAGAVPWYEDPSILARLQKHEELAREGSSVPQIAHETDVSLSTAYEDRKRIQELWLWYVGDSLETLRSKAAQTYIQVQQEAWEQFRETQAATWLKIIIDSQEKLNRLLGLEAPRRVKVDTDIIMSWGDPLRVSEQEAMVIEGVVDYDDDQ